MLSNEFLAAAMAAPSDRLNQAMKILKGESNPSVVEKAPVREKFLTLAQVSAELGINRTTLFRYRIPGHNHHSCVRYRITEILEYFKSDLFKRTIIALKANGWKRPTDEQVANVTLEHDVPNVESSSLTQDAKTLAS